MPWISLKNPIKKDGETMKENNNGYRDSIYLAILESIISLIAVLVYVALGMFNWTIVSGVILGSTVTVVNYLILSYSVNKAINDFIALRGKEEMTDEESDKFAKTHAIKVQNAVTKSYVLRTGLMVGALVVAFITKKFDPIATMIPLIMYKPLLYAIEFIKKKRGE